MTVQPPETPRKSEIPPYPRVLLGRGRWLRVIAVLHRSGTKADAELADYIERQIRGEA